MHQDKSSWNIYMGRTVPPIYKRVCVDQITAPSCSSIQSQYHEVDARCTAVFKPVVSRVLSKKKEIRWSESSGR